MRVAIIGGGVVGCATGLELRRLGFDVAVLDRNGEVGHGSTSASCGVVRTFYSQPGMIAMAQEGACIWQDWDAYVGPVDDDLAVFHRSGLLLIPPRIDDGVRRVVAEMEKLGIRVSILSAEAVAERFPFIDPASQFPPRCPDDPSFFEPSDRLIEGAVYEEGAGYVVFPGLATRNLRDAGEREGVRFLLRRKVDRIGRLKGGRFRLDTSGGAIESEIVVNAAGPHSGHINRLAGVRLPLQTRPLRREVHVLANPGFREGQPPGLPVCADLESGMYFRPEGGERDLVVGTMDPPCDELEWVEDPDDYNENPTELYWERNTLRLMKRFPTVRMGPRRGLANLYDVTLRDWYPIVDRTDLPGYYVAIGTSGSSFKTAPVLGRLMAEIIRSCESGRDTDQSPLSFRLPRAGVSIDTRFLSRTRGEIQTTGTVIG